MWILQRLADFLAEETEIIVSYETVRRNGIKIEGAEEDEAKLCPISILMKEAEKKQERSHIIEEHHDTISEH